MEITFWNAAFTVFILLVLINLFQFIERITEALEKQAGIPSPPARFIRRHNHHSCGNNHTAAATGGGIQAPPDQPFYPPGSR